MKKCPKCALPRPETEFYADRSRKDGLAVYCMDHMKEVQRLRKRARRKPMVLAPKAKIIGAVRRGAETREQLRKTTGIDWDVLCDLLAEMAFDDRTVKINRATRRYSIAA